MTAEWLEVCVIVCFAEEYKYAPPSSDSQGHDIGVHKNFAFTLVILFSVLPV